MLSERQPELVEYLAHSRYVHITSVFDRAAPSLLASLVRAVRLRNPGLVVSVDPGHIWCRDYHTIDGVPEILSLADLLFLNTAEFALLAGPPAELPENDATLNRSVKRS